MMMSNFDLNLPVGRAEQISREKIAKKRHVIVVEKMIIKKFI